MGGLVSYAWTLADNLSDTTLQNPIATPNSTETYYVAVKSDSGCTVYDSLRVGVFFLSHLDAQPDFVNICYGDTVDIVTDLTLSCGTSNSVCTPSISSVQDLDPLPSNTILSARTSFPMYSEFASTAW